METARLIPGFESYKVTPEGVVFLGSRLLKPLQSPGRAARVKLRDSKGKPTRIAVAKLVALAFIPNPEKHSKIIFKDRDKSNCRRDNIQWVSAAEFSRFVNGHAECNDLLGSPRRKREPDWIDPARVPLQGYPGYYISPSGVLYRGSRIMNPVVRKGESLKVRIRQRGSDRYFGLAKLVAEHFIPKPGTHYRYIIFKDRNNRNCRADNIAWVDGETFIYYCGIHVGGRKIVLSREEAIRRCTDAHLRNYYQTLDESWLHACWAEVERKVKLPDWDGCKSDCYLYFIDRARRFSLLRNPAGMLVLHMKGVRANIQKEISWDMPTCVVVKVDESLRIIKRGKNRE